MRYILKHIMQTKFYSWFMLKVVWRFRFTNYYSKFPGWKYKLMYEMLKPGDILVASDKYKLTSVLIAGQWDHAAFFMGKNEEYEVGEFVHSGFRKSAFFDICKEAERVAIYRCEAFDTPYIEHMKEVTRTFESYLYDIRFDVNSSIKALYCSGYIYKLDDEKRMVVSLADLAGLKQPYISPDGLTKGKAMRLVCDSDSLVQNPGNVTPATLK